MQVFFCLSFSLVPFEWLEGRKTSVTTANSRGISIILFLYIERGRENKDREGVKKSNEKYTQKMLGIFFFCAFIK
jgi:hypothetical protein